MADSVDLGPLTHCACGCGEVIPKFDRWGREHAYAHGHHLRAILAKFTPAPKAPAPKS